MALLGGAVAPGGGVLLAGNGLYDQQVFGTVLFLLSQCQRELRQAPKEVVPAEQQCAERSAREEEATRAHEEARRGVASAAEKEIVGRQQLKPGWKPKFNQGLIK